MTAASRISSEITNLGCVGMAGRCDEEGRFNGDGRKGSAASMPSYIRREASLFPLFSFSLPSRALSTPSGYLPHWEGKANGRSFEPTYASNECAFAGSWRDVPYKYAALRVLTQCTTSLKAGMSDRAPLRFPHLSFIQLEPYPARYACHLPHRGEGFDAGKTVFSFRCLPHG